jgi:ABC-type multidrug transport system ATPase subunit
VIEARGLCVGHPDAPAVPLLQGLDFRLRPGLTLLRGGEGRGKTTLLRVLAGELKPAGGSLIRPPGRIFLPQPADPACDPVPARAWLAAQLAGLDPAERVEPGDLTTMATPLIEALGLAPHIDKPLFMLSTGSRRKTGLVAAALAGAAVTLIDQPFAALDARSCRIVAELLAEAAESTGRCWVVADHDRPHWLDGIELAGVVDLGD